MIRWGRNLACFCRGFRPMFFDKMVCVDGVFQNMTEKEIKELGKGITETLIEFGNKPSDAELRSFVGQVLRAKAIVDRNAELRTNEGDIYQKVFTEVKKQLQLQR